MGVSSRRTIRRDKTPRTILAEYMDKSLATVGSKRESFIAWKPRAVSITSVTNPKTNMKVVIPKMIILG